MGWKKDHWLPGVEWAQREGLTTKWQHGTILTGDENILNYVVVDIFVKLTELYTLKSEIYYMQIKNKTEKKKMLLSLLTKRGMYKSVML